MGLVENNNNRTIITISNGKLVVRVTPETEGAVERVNKKGVTVYEKHYPAIEGVVISDVDVKVNQDWDDELAITLHDEQKDYLLLMPLDSRYASSFMMCAKNIRLGEPVNIRPWAKEIEGKMKSRLYIEQNNLTVEPAHTKDEPNGLPMANKVRFQGKDRWDFADQIEFLKKETLEHFGNLKFMGAQTTKITPEAGKVADAPKDSVIIDDDLPF
jgi:hypothetical protein